MSRGKTRHGNKKFLTLTQFRDRLKQLAGKSKDNFIRNELNNGGAELLARTKARTPVDTGALKGSWKVTPAHKIGSGWEVVIRNPMHYASYIEFGHMMKNGNYYEPKYMMTRSANEIQKKFPRELELNLVKWFDDRYTRTEWNNSESIREEYLKDSVGKDD